MLDDAAGHDQGFVTERREVAAVVDHLVLELEVVPPRVCQQTEEGLRI